MPKMMNLVTAGWTHAHAHIHTGKRQQMFQCPDHWTGEACWSQQCLCCCGYSLSTMTKWCWRPCAYLWLYRRMCVYSPNCPRDLNDMLDCTTCPVPIFHLHKESLKTHVFPASPITSCDGLFISSNYLSLNISLTVAVHLRQFSFAKAGSICGLLRRGWSHWRARRLKWSPSRAGNWF